MSFYYIETHFLLCWSSGRIASWINIRITRCRTNAGPVNGILHPIREWSDQIGVIVPETVVECQPNVITVNWSAQIVFDGECVGVPIATFGDVAVRKYKMANAFRSKYSVWLTIEGGDGKPTRYQLLAHRIQLEHRARKSQSTRDGNHCSRFVLASENRKSTQNRRSCSR